jgi:5'-3' exonuclease
MPGHVIVDGNSIGMAQHRATRLTAGTFETQAVFGSVKVCRELHMLYPDRQILWLWDGRAQWRRDIYADYKANRTAKTAKDQAIKEAYQAQVPLIQGSLARLGVKQYLNYAMEADDLAGFMVTRGIQRPILLVTGDRDWCQLIGPGVSWYDPRNEGLMISEATFFEHTSYSTAGAFVQGKALMGDSSDNIGPVGGIGAAGAPEFLALYRDVYTFRERAQRGEFPKLPKAHAQLGGCFDKSNPKCAEWVDTFPLFERNMQLMDLRSVPVPNPAKQHRFNAALDLAGVQTIFQRLAFASLLKDFDNWTYPFTQRATMKEAA